jgi:NADH dehydrogenase FAD-containing subunit
MLPGYIAGSYTKEQCLLDLRHISNFAGANFVQANVTGLDLQKQLVYLENRPYIYSVMIEPENKFGVEAKKYSQEIFKEVSQEAYKFIKNQ